MGDSSMGRQILVVGCGGAGKSTLAVRLGRLLDLPVIHLDREHWLPGWQEPAKEHWASKLRDLVKRPEWIIDGNYGGLTDARAEAADTVIFLDMPRWPCLWRVIKRRIVYHGRTRPDMGPGCPEKLDLEFLRWIWNYNRTQRPAILHRLEIHRECKQVIHLKSRREVQAFVRRLSHPPAQPEPIMPPSPSRSP